MTKIGPPEKFGFFDASETIRKIVFSAVWVHETPIFKGFRERKALKKVRLGGRPSVFLRFRGLRDPGSGMTPKPGFRAAMLPMGALCFYQAHFGRTMLPKWPLWRISSILYLTVLQSQIPRVPAPTYGAFREGLPSTGYPAR